MRGLIFLRILFVFIFASIGYSLGGDNALIFASIGLVFGMGIVFFEAFARKVSLKGLSSAVFGIVLGLIITWIFSKTLNQFSFPSIFNNHHCSVF